MRPNKAHKVEIGDTTSNGGRVYAGISPDTRREMFALSADAFLRIPFMRQGTETSHNPGQLFKGTLAAAKRHAAVASLLRSGGEASWRIPTKNELNILCRNKDKRGLKDIFALVSNHDRFVWSSTLQTDPRAPHLSFAWAQRLSDGKQEYDGTGSHALVVLVTSKGI